MNLNPLQQTLWDMDQLYKATMELYESYFTMLEVAIEKTPETEVEKLRKLSALVQEAQEALNADAATFDKALANDQEALFKLHEGSEIQSIYNKLKT